MTSAFSQVVDDWRIRLAAAGAVACVNGTGATPPATIELQSPPCTGVLELLTVDIAVGTQTQPWVGGQALLAYDTDRLFLVGPLSGDPIFDLPIYFASNPGLGQIDLASGISPGGGSTTADVVLVRLVFIALETPSPCPIEELVWFRTDPNFETRLSMNDGTPINPALMALGAVSITDGPTITPPANQRWGPPVTSGCVDGLDPGFATAVSPCDASPVITWVRSDGELTLDAPYRIIDSPITIEWTATDACGYTATADQTITVNGCLGNLNGDSVVNGFDIAVVLGFWGPGFDYIGDLNCDGMVDGYDIAIVLGNWGPC